MSLRCSLLKALLAAAASLLLLGACTRGNGLPADLLRHLEQRGIRVHLTVLKAPISSRAATVFFEENAELEGKIIAAFALHPISLEDPQARFVMNRFQESPAELWGISGRPATLKTESGTQSEESGSGALRGTRERSSG